MAMAQRLMQREALTCTCVGTCAPPTHTYTHPACAAALVRTPGCLKYSLPPSGWQFKQGMDSYGSDLTSSSTLGGDWTKLIAQCDATPGCRAVNTGGW